MTKHESSVNARAAVIKYGAVLLIGRINSRGKFRYELPGGNPDAGELLRGAAVRETKEETSLDILVDSLFCICRNGVENRVHLATPANYSQRICLESGFRKYVWFTSKEYGEIKMNPSTKYAVKRLLREGYLK